MYLVAASSALCADDMADQGQAQRIDRGEHGGGRTRAADVYGDVSSESSSDDDDPITPSCRAHSSWHSRADELAALRFRAG
jgi:hypothetical protein